MVIDGDFFRLNASEIIKDLFFGLSSQQMYFIIVLIELTLVTPLLIKASQLRFGFKYILPSISFFYLLLVYYQEFLIGEVHYAIGRNLIPWLLFYYIGIFMASHNIKIRYSRTVIFYVCTIAITIVEALIILLMFDKPDFAASQLKFSSYCLAITVIFLEEYLRKIHRGISQNWLSMIGDCSYGIFLIHPFVIKLENAVARRVGLYDVPLPIYEVGQCAITVIICFAVVEIIRRIDNENKVRWLIGF